MDQFMVLCTFRDGTVLSEVFAVVAEEQAAVAALVAEGRLGAIRISLARGAVFIETFAASAEDAAATVGSLPMSRWWDADVYPIAAPVPPGAGA